MSIKTSTLLIWVKTIFSRPMLMRPCCSVSFFELLLSLADGQYHDLWTCPLYLKHKWSVILPSVSGACFRPCEFPWFFDFWCCVNMMLKFLLPFVLRWDVVVMDGALLCSISYSLWIFLGNHLDIYDKLPRAPCINQNIDVHLLYWNNALPCIARYIFLLCPYPV